MYQRLILSLILFVPVFGFGLTADQTTGIWIPSNSTTTVKKIDVQANGNIYIVLDVAAAAWPTAELDAFLCSGNKAGYLELEKSAPNFKEMYAAVTVAYVTKAPVQAHADGCGWYPYASNFVTQ